MTWILYSFPCYRSGGPVISEGRPRASRDVPFSLQRGGSGPVHHPSPSAVQTKHGARLAACSSAEPGPQSREGGPDMPLGDLFVDIPRRKGRRTARPRGGAPDNATASVQASQKMKSPSRKAANGHPGKEPSGTVALSKVVHSVTGGFARNQRDSDDSNSDGDAGQPIANSRDKVGYRSSKDFVGVTDRPGGGGLDAMAQSKSESGSEAGGNYGSRRGGGASLELKRLLEDANPQQEWRGESEVPETRRDGKPNGDSAFGAEPRISTARIPVGGVLRQAERGRGIPHPGKGLVGGRGKVLRQIGPGKPTPGQARALPTFPLGDLKLAPGKEVPSFREPASKEAFHAARKQPRMREWSPSADSSSASEGGASSCDDLDGFSSDEDLKLSLVERKNSPERDARQERANLSSDDEEDDFSEEMTRIEDEQEKKEAAERQRLAREEERQREEEQLKEEERLREVERQREIERLKEIEWQKEEARRRDEERRRGEERWREEKLRKERERRKEQERLKEEERQREQERLAEEREAAEKVAREKESAEKAVREEQRAKMSRKLSALQRIQATIAAAKEAKTAGSDAKRKGAPKIPRAKVSKSPTEFVIAAKVVKKKRSKPTSPLLEPKLKTVRLSMLDIAAAAEEMSPSKARLSKPISSPSADLSRLGRVQLSLDDVDPEPDFSGGSSRFGGKEWLGPLKGKSLREELSSEADALPRLTSPDEGHEVGDVAVGVNLGAGGHRSGGPSCGPVLPGTPRARKEPRFPSGESAGGMAFLDESSDESDEDLFASLDNPEISLPTADVNVPLYSALPPQLMGMKRKALEEEAGEGFEGYRREGGEDSPWRVGQTFPGFGEGLGRDKTGLEGVVRASKEMKVLHQGNGLGGVSTGAWPMIPHPGSGVLQRDGTISDTEADWVIDGDGSQQSGGLGPDQETDRGAADVPLELAEYGKCMLEAGSKFSEQEVEQSDGFLNLGERLTPRMPTEGGAQGLWQALAVPSEEDEVAGYLANGSREDEGPDNAAGSEEAESSEVDLAVKTSGMGGVLHRPGRGGILADTGVKAVG